MRKDDLIKNFNKILRKDPYILSLCHSFGFELDRLDQLGQKVVNNMFFESLDEDLGIPIIAKTLDIQLKEGITLEEKRSIIQAKWKSKGKCTEELLQAVADSWKKGEIQVIFENDLIKVEFINLGGVPQGLEELKLALDKVKPAYLLVDYIYFNFHKNLMNKSHLFLKAYTHKEIREIKFTDYNLLTYADLEIKTYGQLADNYTVLQLMRGEL